MPEPKKKTIYGLDASLPPQQLIEQVRLQLADARGKLADIEREYPEATDYVAAAEGGLFCVLSYLYTSMQELTERRRRAVDGVYFSVRGIGSDSPPCRTRVASSPPPCRTS